MKSYGETILFLASMKQRMSQPQETINFSIKIFICILKNYYNFII